jgi:hypothetical protein
MTVFPESALLSAAAAVEQECNPPPKLDTGQRSDCRQELYLLHRALEEICSMVRTTRNLPDPVDRYAVGQDIKVRVGRIARIMQTFEKRGLLAEASEEVAAVLEAQDPVTRGEVHRLLEEAAAPSRPAEGTTVRPYNTGVSQTLFPAKPMPPAPYQSMHVGGGTPTPRPPMPPPTGYNQTAPAGGGGGYGGGFSIPVVGGKQMPTGPAHLHADLFRTLPPPRPPQMEPGLLDDMVGAGWAGVAMFMQAFAAYFTGRIIGQGHRPWG